MTETAAPGDLDLFPSLETHAPRRGVQLGDVWALAIRTILYVASMFYLILYALGLLVGAYFAALRVIDWMTTRHARRRR
jgi:hypothetical protein